MAWDGGGACPVGGRVPWRTTPPVCESQVGEPAGWRRQGGPGSKLWPWRLVWLAENQWGTAPPNQKVRAAVVEDPARLVARAEPNVRVALRGEPLANGHKVFLVPARVAARTVRVAFRFCNERDATRGCRG